MNLPHNVTVENALRAEIQERGPIDFASFMNISLYGEGGYYSSGLCAIGSVNEGSDFVTSPEVNPAVGATIANYVNGLWEKQGKPDQFPIIEMGAGKGTLARDMLNKLRRSSPTLYKSLRYGIIERSIGLVSVQQKRLADHENVSWIIGNAYELPIGEIDNGVFLSNELVDAFPFHRLKRRNGEIKEVYVGLNNDGEFYETEGELSPSANDSILVDRVMEGRERTVCPASLKWIKAIGNALKKGHVITIDYEQSANPASQIARAYTRATQSIDIGPAITFPGSVDITSSVDFDPVIAAGAEVGLVPIMSTTQDVFLRDHGFYDEVNEQMQSDWIQSRPRHATNDEPPYAYAKQYRWRTNALVMGDLGSYRVLVQEKI